MTTRYQFDFSDYHASGAEPELITPIEKAWREYKRQYVDLDKMSELLLQATFLEGARAQIEILKRDVEVLG